MQDLSPGHMKWKLNLVQSFAVRGVTFARQTQVKLWLAPKISLQLPSLMTLLLNSLMMFRSLLRHRTPLCLVLQEMLVSLLDPLAPVRTLGPIGPGVGVQWLDLLVLLNRTFCFRSLSTYACSIVQVHTYHSYSFVINLGSSAMTFFAKIYWDFTN